MHAPKMSANRAMRSCLHQEAGIILPEAFCSQKTADDW